MQSQTGDKRPATNNSKERQEGDAGCVSRMWHQDVQDRGVAMAERKSAKKRAIKRKSYAVSQGKEDVKQRRKYARGGRIEAYTFGEALSGKW